MHTHTCAQSNHDSHLQSISAHTAAQHARLAKRKGVRERNLGVVERHALALVHRQRPRQLEGDLDAIAGADTADLRGKLVREDRHGAV